MIAEYYTFVEYYCSPPSRDTTRHDTTRAWSSRRIPAADRRRVSIICFGLRRGSRGGGSRARRGSRPRASAAAPPGRGNPRRSSRNASPTWRPNFCGEFAPHARTPGATAGPTAIDLATRRNLPSAVSRAAVAEVAFVASATPLPAPSPFRRSRAANSGDAASDALAPIRPSMPPRSAASSAASGHKMNRRPGTSCERGHDELQQRRERRQGSPLGALLRRRFAALVSMPPQLTDIRRPPSMSPRSSARAPTVLNT